MNYCDLCHGITEATYYCSMCLEYLCDNHAKQHNIMSNDRSKALPILVEKEGD